MDFNTGAEMNQSLKMTAQLIENLRKIRDSEPDDIENRLDLGRALLTVGRYADAEKELRCVFDEGRFFSFRNSVPRIRFKTLFRWRENQIVYARAYADLALVSLNQANLAEAERLLTMALKVFEREGIDAEYYRAANSLGTVYRTAGMFDSALAFHSAAKKIAEKHGKTKETAETTGNIGMVYEADDRFDEALAAHGEALRLYESLGLVFERACQHRQIGLCLLRAGRKDAAAAELRTALSLFEEDDDKVMQSRVLNDLTLTADGVEALAVALEALSRATESGDDLETAENALLYARLKLDEDPADPQIEALLLKSLDVFKSAGRQNETANASSTLGLLYLRRHRWEDAESRFKDSLYLEQRLHRAFGIASDCCNLGLIAANRNDPQRAEEYWSKAVRLFRENGDEDHAREFEERIAGLKGRL